MAVNESQKRSSRLWNRWLMSGAIAGVRYRPGPKGFGTITFNRPVDTREVIALHEKCGLKLPKIEDLDSFRNAIDATIIAEPAPVPTVKQGSWLKPLDRVPFVGCFAATAYGDAMGLPWLDDADWYSNFRFISVTRGS